MKNEEKKKVLPVLLAVLLIVSVVAVAVQASGEIEREIVLVSYEGDQDVRLLDSLGGQVHQTYDRWILASVSEAEREELVDRGFSVSDIPNRSVLSVKSHTFDINQGYPNFSEELLIDDYDVGTRGVYLVHMLGPVHSSWRASLLDKGVDIINYVPNYAYEVVMTPEQVEAVEDLPFVDWVGIYQPGFKLANDIEPGLITVLTVPGSSVNSLASAHHDIQILDNVRRPNGGNALTLYVDSMESIVELARMNEVYYIYQHVEPRLHDEMATQIIGGGLWIYDDDDDPDTPYRAHGTFGSHVNQKLRLSGSGIVIAIADTGIGSGIPGDAGHTDFTGRVIDGHSWGPDPGNWADGHGHGTHCAGSAAGHTFMGTQETFDFADYYMGQGLAYDSELWAEKIFDDEGGMLVGNKYFEIVEIPAQNSTAYIHSNSWGADVAGRYTLQSSEFDMAVRDANRATPDNQPMVITTSAGNSGPDYNTIGTPATAKNVITVGATYNYMPEFGIYNPDTVAGFSSRGWTYDNRVKPDLVAPGHGVVSTMPGEQYAGMSGTSMSNPAVAGAAALVVEWYESLYGWKPSPAMVKAMLINSAYDLCDTGNTGPIPNRDEGWGMVNLPALMDVEQDFMLWDGTELIETGEEHEYTVTWEDDLVPLKFTLVWTDKEAQSGDDWTLKNNLDLEIIAPDGTTYYRGNAFPVDENGMSARAFTSPNIPSMPIFDTNEDGWDDVNNVLNVYIHPDDLEIGEYTVRVIGTNVPEDANNDGDANQDYALFISNAVDPADLPTVELTSPYGGETWYNAETEDIEWDSTPGADPISEVDLLYSLDDGGSWTPIPTGIFDMGDELPWPIPDAPSNRARVRIIVRDDNGLSRMHTSGHFDIVGTAPGSPDNLAVEHGYGLTTIVVDDFQDGDYTRRPEWTVHDGVWDVGEEDDYRWLEGRGRISTPYERSAYGRWEWDFQFSDIDIVGRSIQLMRFYFVQDTPDPGSSSFSGYYVIITGNVEEPYGTEPQVNLWRFDDGEAYEVDGRAMLGGSWPANTNWNTLAVERDLGGNFSVYVNDIPIGYVQDNTYQTTEYIGFSHTTPNVDTRHRVGEMRHILELEGDEHNLVTWDRSPDDGVGRNSVSHYSVHRAISEGGPYVSVGTVDADGSDSYMFRDHHAGTHDHISWWYTVYAVDIHGQLNEVPVAPSQEPLITETDVSITSPEDGALINKDSVTIRWDGQGEYYNLFLNDDDPILKYERTHNFINLPDGVHTVAIEAVGAGESSWDEIDFVIDTTPPALDISTASGGITFEEDILITGVTEPDATVTINGVSVSVDETTGAFQRHRTLANGLNMFNIVATDPAGNKATATLYALYMPDIPALYDAIDSLQDDVADLQSSVGSLQAQVTSINREIDDLWEDSVELWNETGNMLSYFEDERDRLEGLISNLDSDIRSLSRRLDATLDDLDKALADNRTDIVDDVDSRISELREEISDMEDNASAISTELTNLGTEFAAFRAEQVELGDERDSDISQARNMALIGIFMAVIALILVIFYALMTRGKDDLAPLSPKKDKPKVAPKEEEEPLFEEEEI